MAAKKEVTVDSPPARVKLDVSGSPVAVARINAAQAYLNVPVFLTSVNDGSSGLAPFASASM